MTNFKERVRRALRQPTRYPGGGYIQNAGGGDQIVYGPTHEEGGVDRGPDVELEGGGFDPITGKPLQGEVITNIMNTDGNMTEFYMSDENGVADEYLQAKADAGGALPQEAKQYFARVNEQRSSEGNPSKIAAGGGWGMGAGEQDRMKYLGGGYGPEGDYWRNVQSQAQSGGSGQTELRGGGYGPTSKYFQRLRHFSNQRNAEEGQRAQGGRKKYFMGGTEWVNLVTGQRAQGGPREQYEHGGPHPEVTGTDQNQSVLSQGRDKQSWGSKTWDVLTNPVQAFAQYNKYGELKDYFADDESAWEGKSMDFGLSWINPLAYIDMAIELEKEISEHGVTKSNVAALTLLAATKGKSKALTQKLTQISKTINKTKVGRVINPTHGWKSMGKTTTKKTNIIKTKGSPGKYTVKSITPMLETVTRGAGTRFKAAGSNLWNLTKKAGVYSTPWAVYQGVTGEDEGATTTNVDELDFSNLDFSVSTDIPTTTERTDYTEPADSIAPPNPGDTIPWNDRTYIFSNEPGADPADPNNYSEMPQ